MSTRKVKVMKCNCGRAQLRNEDSKSRCAKCEDEACLTEALVTDDLVTITFHLVADESKTPGYFLALLLEDESVRAKLEDAFLNVIDANEATRYDWLNSGLTMENIFAHLA